LRLRVPVEGLREVVLRLREAVVRLAVERFLEVAVRLRAPVELFRLVALRFREPPELFRVVLRARVPVERLREVERRLPPRLEATCTFGTPSSSRCSSS